MYLSMKKEIRNKTFVILLEEVWEEIEVQFYGIIGAIFFFILVYLIFQPPWIKAALHIFFGK